MDTPTYFFPEEWEMAAMKRYCWGDLCVLMRGARFRKYEVKQCFPRRSFPPAIFNCVGIFLRIVDARACCTRVTFFKFYFFLQSPNTFYAVCFFDMCFSWQTLPYNARCWFYRPANKRRSWRMIPEEAKVKSANDWIISHCDTKERGVQVKGTCVWLALCSSHLVGYIGMMRIASTAAKRLFTSETSWEWNLAIHVTWWRKKKKTKVANLF